MFSYGRRRSGGRARRPRIAAHTAKAASRPQDQAEVVHAAARGSRQTMEGCAVIRRAGESEGCRGMPRGSAYAPTSDERGCGRRARRRPARSVSGGNDASAAATSASPPCSPPPYSQKPGGSYLRARVVPGEIHREAAAAGSNPPLKSLRALGSEAGVVGPQVAADDRGDRRLVDERGGRLVVAVRSKVGHRCARGIRLETRVPARRAVARARA